MQTSDIVKLVNAGFTKEEIMQLASPAQTHVQAPVQTPTQVQPPTPVQPQVQPPNVDYKMLYETQKQMLADMQSLNQRMNIGAPIDTVESVMKDFLGGEK